MLTTEATATDVCDLVGPTEKNPSDPVIGHKVAIVDFHTVF